MRRAPIRTRLTAWYVLGLTLVLLALGTFIITRLRADLTTELDRELVSAAAQIGRGYAAEGAPELRDVTATVLPGPRNQGSGSQILDSGGAVLLYDGDPITRAPLVDPATRGQALRGRPVIVSGRLGHPGRHVRIVAVPVRRGGRTSILAVVSSLAEVDDSVRRVIGLLLAGGAAALALVAVGGWWLARAALRPVERMTTRAEAIGVSGLSERITEPRARDEVGHLARTLNAMLDRLEAGVTARERLVADASHELRAPLAAMRSELEVSLREDELDAPAYATLSSLHEEVLRMARIVDGLLTLARVDEGLLELLSAPADLRSAAERAVAVQRPAAEARGVRVGIDGENVTVSADRDRLDQVLDNLLDNAVRYATREVRVSLWANGAMAGIRVADDGPGVPVAARERIFERFAREDPARGRTGGAGLGLAICREIVLAHRGRIWAENAQPLGAVLVVALPRDSTG